ncbi:MAG: DUF2878 domain-containing protein [Desulfoferrobacter sp.]
MRTLINVLAFQAGWFASVVGAARDLPWLGPLVVVLVVACNLFKNPRWPAEVALSVAAAVFGFIVDTALVACGVFAPVRYWLSPPLSPIWMVFMWINFATLLNASLKWLHGRYLLAAFLGALGGPAAYYGGAQLGATQEAMGMASLLVLAVVWSVAVPALFFTAKIIESRVKT